MKIESLFLVMQLLLALVLAYTCFCRIVKTDADTVREVRWAILFEGVAAGMVLGAPFMPMLMPREIHWPAWSTPPWIWLTLLLAVTLVQITTARFWENGKAPAQFQAARWLEVPRSRTWC